MNDDDMKLEAFSALLDGETEPVEHKPLLTALADDVAARASLARYRLIGDSLRGEAVRPDALAIADAVRERLQREPVVLAPPSQRPAGRPSMPRWWQATAGVAIAASVALVAVGLMPRMLSNAPQTAPSPAVQVVSVPAVSPVFVSATAPQWQHSETTQESRLSRYLADHSEAASQTGIPGIVPYASFVSYDAQQ
jgi:sigma-E factor negative regulatory protein RseA